jgi:hypothetical protein
VDRQSSIQAEQMIWLQVAEYLSVMRDSLVETSQVLEDALFEMNTNRRHAIEEVSREVLNRANR